MEVVTTTFSAGTVVNARLALVRLCTCHHVVLVDRLSLWEVDPRPMALHARKVKEDRELKQARVLPQVISFLDLFLGMYIVYVYRSLVARRIRSKTVQRDTRE